ncbi:MAG TPA: lysylphosphatidylglycerol synthase transmembrane domain-containing protein [Anaerolineaceae bacterium]|nr:lysylphosphatidylglycerol synthase transmembrane domain-containing protein [Anaerolineaceae bacterium]
MKQNPNLPERPIAESQPVLASPGLKIEYWQTILGLILSLGSLFLAFRGISFSQIADAVPTINLGLLGLAVLASIVTLVAKGARWILLFNQRPPSFQRSFRIQTIGIFINAIAPARLGDLLRAYLMGDQERHSKVFVLGTIVVEKVIDMFFLVVSMVVLLPQMVFPNWVSEPSELTAILLAALILVCGLILWKRDSFLGLMEKVSVIFPGRIRGWLLRQLKNLVDSLECVRNPRQLAGIMVWSLLVWVLGFGTNLLTFWALGLSVSTLAAVFLLVVLQVGVAVPSSPGRIGVFHYLTILALSVFSIPREAALGCGIVLHLVVYVPLFLLGAFFIWSEKLSWGKITHLLSRVSLKDNHG